MQHGPLYAGAKSHGDERARSARTQEAHLCYAGFDVNSHEFHTATVDSKIGSYVFKREAHASFQIRDWLCQPIAAHVFNIHDNGN